MNSKNNYRIRAERIEEEVTKYMGSLLKENGLLEQAFKQAFGGENTNLKELEQEIVRKEKEIQQCEKVLEVMSSQARIQLMANPELINDILLEGVRLRKESEDRINALDKELELLYANKDEIDSLNEMMFAKSSIMRFRFSRITVATQKTIDSSDASKARRGRKKG